MAWFFLLLSAAFLLLALYSLRERGPQRRLHRIQARLAILAGRAVPATECCRLLKTVFALIARQAAADEKAAYQAVALLQTAYGQGLSRADEPVHITALAASLLSQNKPGLAAAVLDCYRGLLRNLASAQMAAEQLQTAGVLAMKAKQSFVAVKAIDILFAVLEKPEHAADPQAVTAALGTVRVIGRLALGRGELDFFRELAARLQSFFAASPPPAVEAATVAGLFSAWLQVIVDKQDEAALALLVACVQQLTESKLPDAASLDAVFSEWVNLTAIAGINPQSRIAVKLVGALTIWAERTQTAALWEKLVTAVMQTARILLEQQGLRAAFLLLQPILDRSRIMLGEQIRFPAEVVAGDFRRQALFCVTKEFLAVAEFAARLRIPDTAYQVIEAFYCCWRDDPALNYQSKSARKFFQLLVIFWQKHMLRRADCLPPQPELLAPPLLTTAELERLGFVLKPAQEARCLQSAGTVLLIAPIPGGWFRRLRRGVAAAGVCRSAAGMLQAASDLQAALHTPAAG